MSKAKERALTYSILAHIRNKGQLVKGILSVFVPLVKRAIFKLNEDGFYKGSHISEIKEVADNLFKIDFPLSVLRKILVLIANEENSKNGRTTFHLYNDGSFEIEEYSFSEFEEVIAQQQNEVEDVEKAFKEFCSTLESDDVRADSIFQFIEKNKYSLSKYLAHKNIDDTADYRVQASFVEFFKAFPKLYDTIRKIYLGSILVSYLEYKTESLKTNIELVLDTNFILGMFDLNTPESTHTCGMIVDIAKKQGYRLTVLSDTVNETQGLLNARAAHFNTTFLQKKMHTEDIYNACDRRKLSSSDLERISDNLERDLGTKGVTIIHDTSKYSNIARFSSEYEKFKLRRNSHAAALHDATVIHYVRLKRGKRIRNFEDVNCWFINNSVTRDRFELESPTVEYQDETIKADDFLNIVWLSNPSIETSVLPDEVAEVGLSVLVSTGLSSSLPKLSVIRELDENLQKYSQEGLITDTDIVRIGTRIAARQLIDLENLTALARNNKEQFVKRINDEARKQKELDEERLRKMNKLVSDLVSEAAAVQKLKASYEAKAASIESKAVNDEADIFSLSRQIDEYKKIEQQRKSDLIRIRRKEFENKELRKWRRKTYFEAIIYFALGFAICIYLLSNENWDVDSLVEKYKKDWKIYVFVTAYLGIFTIHFVRKWYDENYSYSNIENYKKNIEYPDDLII